MKRRALVLTNESARHPFRQSLAPHIFKVEREGADGKARRTADDDDQDWKLFVMSFAAFFTVFYSFIA